MRHRFRGEGAIPRLEVLGAAFLFSTGGAAIKATTLTPWQVAGGRSGVAAIALALMIPAARRSLSWACERALRLFAEGPRALDPVRRRGMEQDFSWDHSARLYDHVLERAALREKRRVLLEY